MNIPFYGTVFSTGVFCSILIALKQVVDAEGPSGSWLPTEGKLILWPLQTNGSLF